MPTTYNLHTAPTFALAVLVFHGYRPRLPSRTNTLPQIEHIARSGAALPAGGLIHADIGPTLYLTMLQRLTQTLPNNRLCVNIPLLVAGCHPPFTWLPMLITSRGIFQLSKTVHQDRLQISTLETSLPDRAGRCQDPILEG